MCAVAGRGLFRGLSADDLGVIGVGFSLFDMPALATLACRIVAEEAALRRPVGVAINTAVAIADSSPPASVESTPASSELPGRPGGSAATARDEGSFDVPIGRALARSNA